MKSCVNTKDGIRFQIGSYFSKLKEATANVITESYGANCLPKSNTD